MGVGVQAGQQCARPLGAESGVQAAPLVSIPEPLAELLIREPLLGFCDCPAPDPAQYQLMPDFILKAQVFFFFSEKPLTSPITRSSSSVKSRHSGPRSGSASPVTSASVNTGLPFKSAVAEAIRLAMACLRMVPAKAAAQARVPTID